jgi:hypothetical protein
MTNCYKQLGKIDIDTVLELESYLDSIFPDIIRESYPLTDNVYFTFHMKYLFDPSATLDMDSLSWYGNGERTVDLIYDAQPLKIYKVVESVRRGTIDIIAIVDDAPGNEEFKNFINTMEETMKRKVIKVAFSICGPGHRIKLHKDFSVKYDNKLHLVINNGDISSLIWYDDDFKELERCNGQSGDLFYFEGDKYFHRFDRPKSKRVHLIMCFE